MARRNVVIAWEEGWGEIKTKGIDKLESMLYADGKNPCTTRLFSPREYVHIYATVYDMSVSPNRYARELYVHHGQAMEEYLTMRLLPALQTCSTSWQQGQGEDDVDNKDKYERSVLFLVELRYQWGNHLILNKWMGKFFAYLERDFVRHAGLPPLCQAGMRSFCTLVYQEIKGEAVCALLSLIQDCRRRARVTERDRSLIQATHDLFETMRRLPKGPDTYLEDFEKPLLDASRKYLAPKQQQQREASWRSRQGLGTTEYLIQVTIALATEYCIADQLVFKNQECNTPVKLHSFVNHSIKTGTAATDITTQSKLLDMVREEILEKQVDKSFQFVFSFL